MIPCRPGLFLTITAYSPSGICNSSRTRWSSSWVRSASNSLVWRSCWLSFLRGCTLFAILIKNAQWLHVYSLQYLGCIEIHTVYIYIYTYREYKKHNIAHICNKWSIIVQYYCILQQLLLYDVICFQDSAKIPAAPGPSPHGAAAHCCVLGSLPAPGIHHEEPLLYSIIMYCMSYHQSISI